MEVDSDKPEIIKMPPYERLHAIVQEINSKPVGRTTDWYDEHNSLVREYKDYFTTFIDVNPEIEDATFRMNCKIVDALMDKLLIEYNTYRWFSLYDYCRFNQTLINMLDFIFQRENIAADTSGLADMFDVMKV
jgi:hypothetical protein